MSSEAPIEVIRARFRPERIRTLFVGESAPASGNFFYCGNTSMAREMQKAVEAGLGPTEGDFPKRFKALCWYLDDLVLEPVNHLKRGRRAKCRAAQSSLATRIAEYQPEAIVVLLKGIKEIVFSAAIAAGSKADLYAVSFPGCGQQTNFQREMACIIRELPRCLPASPQR